MFVAVGDPFLGPKTSNYNSMRDVKYCIALPVHESLANARVTRESGACMKAPREEI